MFVLFLVFYFHFETSKQRKFKIFIFFALDIFFCIILWIFFFIQFKCMWLSTHCVYRCLFYGVCISFIYLLFVQLIGLFGNLNWIFHKKKIACLQKNKTSQQFFENCTVPIELNLKETVKSYLLFETIGFSFFIKFSRKNKLLFHQTLFSFSPLFFLLFFTFTQANFNIYRKRFAWKGSFGKQQQ